MKHRSLIISSIINLEQKLDATLHFGESMNDRQTEHRGMRGTIAKYDPGLAGHFARGDKKLSTKSKVDIGLLGAGALGAGVLGYAALRGKRPMAHLPKANHGPGPRPGPLPEVLPEVLPKRPNPMARFPSSDRFRSTDRGYGNRHLPPPDHLRLTDRGHGERPMLTLPPPPDHLRLTDRDHGERPMLTLPPPPDHLRLTDRDHGEILSPPPKRTKRRNARTQSGVPPKRTKTIDTSMAAAGMATELAERIDRVINFDDDNGPWSTAGKVATAGAATGAAGLAGLYGVGVMSKRMDRKAKKAVLPVSDVAGNIREGYNASKRTLAGGLTGAAGYLTKGLAAKVRAIQFKEKNAYVGHRLSAILAKVHRFAEDTNGGTKPMVQKQKNPNKSQLARNAAAVGAVAGAVGIGGALYHKGVQGNKGGAAVSGVGPNITRGARAYAGQTKKLAGSAVHAITRGARAYAGQTKKLAGSAVHATIATGKAAHAKGQSIIQSVAGKIKKLAAKRV